VHRSRYIFSRTKSGIICDTDFLFRDGNVQKLVKESIVEEGNQRKEIHLSLVGCYSCSSRDKEAAGL